LAFKVSPGGYKVLYQPLSEVIHYEGATGELIFLPAPRSTRLLIAQPAEAWADELITRPANGDGYIPATIAPGRKTF